jgi:hypothetical protein
MSVRPCRYRHYKGNEYTVIGIARHSETDEELVVYRPEYGDRSLWVPPSLAKMSSSAKWNSRDDGLRGTDGWR